MKNLKPGDKLIVIDDTTNLGSGYIPPFKRGDIVEFIGYNEKYVAYPYNIYICVRVYGHIVAEGLNINRFKKVNSYMKEYR